MTYETIRLTIEDGLATITLAQPDSGNAVAEQFGQEFRAAALICHTDPSVRAVLLRAEGKAFCVGGNVKDFVTQSDLPRAVKHMTIDFHAALSMLARMDAPLVCAVQGVAAGAGLTMVCAADYAIAGKAAAFTYAYSGVGFTADGGLTWLLPRLVGLRNFQSLVFTGRVVNAEEALALGIVSELVDDDALAERAESFARRLASGPTKAYGGIKRLALASFSHEYEAHQEAEAQALIIAAGTEDARNAIAAVAKRQKPEFKGR
jgi:2-(1,2-epoxy-1,2-dihydrophenyl)acetyl-CoA isomerase